MFLNDKKNMLTGSEVYTQKDLEMKGTTIAAHIAYRNLAASHLAENMFSHSRMVLMSNLAHLHRGDTCWHMLAHADSA